MDVTVTKSTAIKGIAEIPADKSITHRAFMFAALTGGRVKIKNYSKGADCMSTLGIIQKLGCKVEFINDKELIIDSKDALKAPSMPLDCGNSGTTARLMSGILAGQDFDCRLFGDESLTKRPMKRIIEPLELMGAEFVHEDYRLPYEIKGRNLHGIEYESPLSSAQVKSCILSAGLFADGITVFSEPYQSRNHTELMFKHMGADITVKGKKIEIKKSKLQPVDIKICGDISSAAFFIAAALIVPGSDVIITNVGINETRAGILEVLRRMNANIETLNIRTVSGEKTADLRIKYSELKSTTIIGSVIPRMIDELPVFAVIATQAEGKTVIKDASDLRNKESDRISVMTKELKKLGADIEETPDGFIIRGKKELTGNCETDCCTDHRIAMSLYVAGLICKQPVKINNFEWVNISFPEFQELFSKLTYN